MPSTGHSAFPRRDVINLCAFIFLADVFSGLLAPTFSLYAANLGASVVLIGLLASVAGLTATFSAVPLGLLSDRLGRRPLLLVGMLAWALAMLTFALAPNAYALLPGKILTGVAMILTFAIGTALLGDLTEGPARGYAFGLYATAMGLGFAVGAMLGGLIGSRYGLGVTYQVAAALAAGGLVFGWRTLTALPARGFSSEAASLRRWPARRQLAVVLGNPNLALACLAGLLQTAAFGGAVTTFFPLYGDRLFIGPAVIGTMFSLRSFISTGARLPMGFLAASTSTGAVMALSLGLIGLALLGIGQSASPTWLALFLVAEGIGFGGFVTAGQAFIAEHAADEVRGTAIGVNRTVSGLGNTVSPLALGAVASTWGIAAVFRLTGVFVIAGALVIAAALYLQGRRGGTFGEPSRPPGDAPADTEVTARLGPPEAEPSRRRI